MFSYVIVLTIHTRTHRHYINYVCILYIYYLIIHNYLYQCSLFMWIWINIWVHLLSAWKTSDSISCKVGLYSTNYQVLVIWGCLHFWKVALLDVGFFVEKLFLLWALWICCPTVWPLLFLVISQPILLQFFYKWWVIYLLLLSEFSPLAFSIFAMMSVDLCTYPMWSLFSNVDYIDKYFSINLGNF